MQGLPVGSAEFYLKNMFGTDSEAAEGVAPVGLALQSLWARPIYNNVSSKVHCSMARFPILRHSQVASTGSEGGGGGENLSVSEEM